VIDLWNLLRTHAQAEGPVAATAATTPGVGRCRLDQLEPGERSIILRLEGGSAIERRLMELGFVPGTAVEVVRRAPFGDPVEVRVRDVSLSLRRSETSRIHVAPR
jgi:ferrous iron transport protein A